MPNDFVRRLRVPIYLLVAFLSVGSLVEVLVASWPIHAHDVNWRIGALNAAAGATGTEMLALLILIVAAHATSARAALWAGFVFAVLGAVALGAVAGTFGLDCLQLRARIPSEQLSRFDVTVAWSLTRFAFTDLVCLWLGVAALKAARALGHEAARAAAGPRSDLIVGKRAPRPQGVSVGS